MSMSLNTCPPDGTNPTSSNPPLSGRSRKTETLPSIPISPGPETYQPRRAQRPFSAVYEARGFAEGIQNQRCCYQ